MIPATLPLSREETAVRSAFLRWQCRIRQIMMRDDLGRPGDGIMPAVTLAGQEEPLGHVITVMSKSPGHAVTAEMQHMARKTNDPAQRRENAMRFFSETYYQKAETFSDILTSTFPPASPGAKAIREAEFCALAFDAYRQKYTLPCRIWTLAEHNPLFQATYWHNHLFNPALTPECTILGFEPDWSGAIADPAVKGA